MKTELPVRSPGLIHLEGLLSAAEMQRQAAEAAAAAAARRAADASAKRYVRWSTRGRLQATPA